jgi:hypothetical protein
MRTFMQAEISDSCVGQTAMTAVVVVVHAVEASAQKVTVVVCVWGGVPTFNVFPAPYAIFNHGNCSFE